MTDYTGLRLDKRGHTALVTLNNPPAHTWTQESLAALTRLVGDLNADRDIWTLVQEDGAIDPASRIDMRDSATPLAMAKLVKGLYDGRWLTRSSRNVLLGAMERCKTGPQRIKGQMPSGVMVAHKTGTLWNTSSDVGIVTGPDGHAIALAIYVTGGKSDHKYRFEKIATIARAVYDGYQAQPAQVWASASYDRSQTR